VEAGRNLHGASFFLLEDRAQVKQPLEHGGTSLQDVAGGGSHLRVAVLGEGLLHQVEEASLPLQGRQQRDGLAARRTRSRFGGGGGAAFLHHRRVAFRQRLVAKKQLRFLSHFAVKEYLEKCPK